MLAFCMSLINSILGNVLKRLHCPLEVMLTCVRWYVTYQLSLHRIEEMMQEAVFSWIKSRCVARCSMP